MRRTLGFRLLVALHRWLGALLCVPFLIWFLSGIVLTFAGFPRLTETVELSLSAPLTAERIRVPLDEALAESAHAPEWVSLASWGDRPVWRLESRGELRVIDAELGSPVNPVSIDAALATAAYALQRPAGELERELVEAPDQWNPFAARRHELPLLRVHANDADATELYVSLPRAQLVQRTTRASRTLAWLGAIPHWWYPVALRQHGAAWRSTVLWGSGLGAVACLAGLVLGAVQLARTLSASGRRRASPYADRWLRWHHLLGLAFGLPAFSWIASGMLSLNPGRWSSGPGPSASEMTRFTGSVDLARVSLGAQEAVEICARELEVKALVLVWLGGHPYWHCRESFHVSRLVDAAAPGSRARAALGLAEVRAALRAAQLGAIVEEQWLEAPDDYVYPTHLDAELRFPLARFKLANGTWWYVDPHSAAPVRRYDQSGRLERWVYQGLHRLDFSWLYERRGLWRFVVVSACAAGAASSATGVVIGIRVLGRFVARRVRRRNQLTRSLARPQGARLSE